MKPHHILPFLALLAGLLSPAQAQPGSGRMGPGGPTGPRFNAAMNQLFGENKTFSADVELQTSDPSRGNVTMSGKIAFDSGKTRFEMDITQIKGGALPPQQAAQVKAMGMGEIVAITRPDTRQSYLVYPGLESYAVMPLTDADTPAAENKFKVEITELGKETIAGQPCIKNKVTVTDDRGKKHEATTWNATNLKKFPVKMETQQDGQPITMLYKNIKLAAPAASQFEPPASYTKYDNVMSLMQGAMMKRIGAGGFPQPK
jgi:hypothetical protein